MDAETALAALAERIRRCRKCRLWRGATHAVPGEGPANAAVMLVGEAPGANEDKTGRPFVGMAGRYLERALAAEGIDRDAVFITGSVKHRTPRNRSPRTDEIAACRPWLLDQVAILRPRLIVLMGLTAWKMPRLPGIRFVETYHPAAAMRFPVARRRFEKDLGDHGEEIRGLIRAQSRHRPR